MGKRTIIFYAPVGTNLPVHLLGGGEKGCRRTREILSNAGYNVITIDKATMSHGAVSYVKSAIHAIAKTKKKLHENPDAILYIVGFYEKNLPLEWILINSGEKKRKTIYEARNGRLVKAYKEKGNLYKKLMDSVLKRADVIFAQGLEYVDFIKKTYGKKAVYTPNYVLNRSLKPYIADRPFDTIRLIYFGRVSESKNVDVVIKVAYELEKAGYKTSTTVIGGGDEVVADQGNNVGGESLNVIQVPDRSGNSADSVDKASATVDIGHLVLCDNRVVCRHHYNELLPSNE